MIITSWSDRDQAIRQMQLNAHPLETAEGQLYSGGPVTVGGRRLEAHQTLGPTLITVEESGESATTTDFHDLSDATLDLLISTLAERHESDSAGTDYEDKVSWLEALISEARSLPKILITAPKEWSIEVNPSIGALKYSLTENQAKCTYSNLADVPGITDFRPELDRRLADYLAREEFWARRDQIKRRLDQMIGRGPKTSNHEMKHVAALHPLEEELSQPIPSVDRAETPEPADSLSAELVAIRKIDEQVELLAVVAAERDRKSRRLAWFLGVPVALLIALLTALLSGSIHIG
jgi:hypothetical protein